MRRLLAISAILEAVTGVTMLTAPSLVSAILLGTPLDGAAPRVVARIAGVALLAIGVHCWQARGCVESPTARGVAGGMLLYNCGVVLTLVIASAGGADRLQGIGLWPAVGLHSILAAWCLVCVARRGQHNSSGPAGAKALN